MADIVLALINLDDEKIREKGKKKRSA